MTLGGHVVGRPVQQALRTTKASDEVPLDIAAIVSMKFTLGIVLTQQSYYRSEKRYQVASVVIAHGRQRALPVASGNSGEASQTVVQTAAEAVVLNPGTPAADPLPEDLASDKTPPPTPDVVEMAVLKLKTRTVQTTGV